MDNEFAAANPALGYFYQARYALYAAMLRDEATIISIEKFDDVAFEKSGSSTELLQLKHHTNAGNLTNVSSDLWKTLRVWSKAILDDPTVSSKRLFILITTANIASGSIADMLTAASRNSQSIAKRLTDITQQSTNKDLKDPFDTFNRLSNSQKLDLVNSILILANSPNIVDIPKQFITSCLSTVRRQHRNSVYLRLEGWWFDRVIKHLSGTDTSPIYGTEIRDRISDIAEQFYPEALPIDFFSQLPPNPPDPTGDNRIFVIQLREILLHHKYIEKAITDFYRAFEQRSKWISEDLLFTDELVAYEARLVDEWERFYLECTCDCDIASAADSELISLGRKIFFDLQQRELRIRPHVTEPYVMRGSLQMLANESSPRVHWHPTFIERLKVLMATPVAV